MKTKFLAFILVVLTLIVGGLSYVLVKKNQKLVQLESQLDKMIVHQLQQSKEPIQQVDGTTTVQDETQGVKKFSELEGKIVGVSPESWIIDQKTGAIEVKLTSKTLIYKGEKEKADVVDIRAGKQVKIKLDDQTREVIEAIIN